jgi:hypothetical protein
MGQIRDWGAMREMCARLLKERTGEDVDTWNQRTPSKIHETMKLQISLSTVKEVDSGVLDWMQPAFDENS